MSRFASQSPGTGYMRVELLRLLALHPRVDIAVRPPTVRRRAPADVYPPFATVSISGEDLDRSRLAEGAASAWLPHGTAAATIVEAQSDVVVFDPA
jgi:N-acetyl-gamma-glutamylphosphate reductase